MFPRVGASLLLRCTLGYFQPPLAGFLKTTRELVILRPMSAAFSTFICFLFSQDFSLGYLVARGPAFFELTVEGGCATRAWMDQRSYFFPSPFLILKC